MYLYIVIYSVYTYIYVYIYIYIYIIERVKVVNKEQMKIDYAESNKLTH